MEERYERDAEAFIEGLNREYYLNGAGLKENLEIAPLFERYGWLFTAEAIKDLLANKDDVRSLYLAQFGVESYLENTVKELSEETTNAMMQARIEWDGQEVPYRYASVVLANEPDPARRRELHKRITGKTAEFNPKLGERMRRLHAEAKGLGYPDYVTLWDELGGLKLDELRESMGRLLAETSDTYYRRLDEMLPTVGVTREDATTADLGHLFRAPQFDSLFPKENLVPALKRTLSGLGLDIDAQPNLHLDIEPRPLKSPRAFCATIRVPDEVMLVIMPRGGQDDYAAILHEAGHAEHYANVDRDLPFVFKHLGDNSVTEGYAILLDTLTRSPRWLAEVAGIADPSAYLRLARFQHLYMLRRYASKLHYEMRLHRSDLAGMDEVYSAMLGGNLGVTVARNNYLNDVDDSFYAARYLRAWIFEAQLRRYLERQYGEAWYASRDAGEFLIGLWRQGQRHTADELARQLGYSGLDIAPLMEDLLA